MDSGVIEGGLNVTLTIRLLMHGKVRSPISCCLGFLIVYDVLFMEMTCHWDVQRAGTFDGMSRGVVSVIGSHTKVEMGFRIRLCWSSHMRGTCDALPISSSVLNVTKMVMHPSPSVLSVRLQRTLKHCIQHHHESI